MKRLILFLFVLALVLSFAVTGYAQEADLVLSDVEANPGDTVYLTVTLQTELMADAIGLSYTYDKKMLEPMPTSSWSWEVKGVLKNFDIKKDRAAWGADTPTQLRGDICVMAFRVLENAKLTQTKVTCELIFKNQGEEVGTYTAQGVIGKHCAHEYNTWTSKDDLWHTVECKLCGKVLTQSHMWDDGVEKNTDGNRTMLFTCTGCHMSRETELAGTMKPEIKPTGPANPAVTDPTVPSSTPNQGTTEQQHEENKPDTVVTLPNNDHKDHDHQNTDTDTQLDPTNDDKETVKPTEEHTHDHSGDTQTGSESNPVTGIVVAVTVAVLLGAAVYFVKKK